MPTLRARWHGDPPSVGHYLMSRVRPRNAYRIVTITPRSGSGGGGVLELECERLPATDVPKDAVVHDWRWDPRTKAGSAWSG